MRLKETLIIYKRASTEEPNGSIVLLPLCSDFPSGWASTGGCYARVQDMTSEQESHFLFNLAMHLIIRDQIKPEIVHNAFCKIREYRNGLAYDVPIPKPLQRNYEP